MMQAHRTSLLVEVEDGVKLDVRTITQSHVGSAAFTVGEGIGRGIDDGEVYMTRHIVEGIDACIGWCLRTGCEEQGQVGTCAHTDCANLLRVEASLLCLAANHANGSLPVFPSRLIDGQTFGSRGSIDKVDALEAQLREALCPELDEVVVACVVVAATRNENHTPAVWRLRLSHPFQERHSRFVGIKAFCVDFGSHSRNLLRLCVRHLAFRPERDVFSCLHSGCHHDSQDYKKITFHIYNSACIRAKYLPMMSNSRLTTVPSLMAWKLVLS